MRILVDSHSHPSCCSRDRAPRGLHLLSSYEEISLSLLQKDLQATWAYGFHPWWVQREELCWETLYRLLGSEQCVALGEVGLDKYRARGPQEKKRQMAVLWQQLSWAKDMALPVVFHCVGWHGTLLELIDKLGALPQGGVIHDFSGSREMASAYLERGLSLGFGVSLLQGSGQLNEILKDCPQEHIFLESDAPFRSLEGEEDPWKRIQRVYEKVCEVKNWTLEQAVGIMESNMARLFPKLELNQGKQAEQ